MRYLFIAVALIFTVLTTQQAAAQGMIGAIRSADESAAADNASDSGTTASDARLQTLINQARESGTPFIVMPIDETTAASPGATTASSLSHTVVVRNAIRDTFAALPRVPSEIGATLTSADEREGLGWFVYGVLISLLALAGAFGARILIERRGMRSIAKLDIDPEKDRVALVSLVLMRLAVHFLSVIGFAAAGYIIATIIVPFTNPMGWTAHVAILSVGVFLLVSDVFGTLFSPKDSRLRMPNFSDEDAARMLRQFLSIAAVGLTLLGLATWLTGLGLDERPADLLRVVTSFIVIVLLIAYVIAHRQKVAKVFRGRSPTPPAWRKGLAAVWHIVVIAYLVGAAAHNIEMIVTSSGPRMGPILSPIVGALAGFIAFALALIIIDRRVKASQEALYHASAGTARGVGPEGTPAEIADAPPDASEDLMEPVTRWQLRWKRFADRVAAMSALIVALIVTAAVSGNLDRHTEAGEWVGIAVILYVTYVLYQGLKTWIDGKIEDEEGPATVASEDGMGAGASRLATLLPLLRNLLIVVVFALIGTIVLAGMGVNVAPLFAGAGIIGLAVGFGAQTLIRDIFSGAFFLADDAFRRGEYIDIGGVMGSVEKISVRSFQLRHQNGPLHTIPFGEIKQLTNYSRDWAIMKLKLRLVYGTDIEKVRKLIKKLGQQLAADPEIGHLFIDPLKSQGVVEMEDSAMICRVKFMTRPGDQFLARRHVYARIHELFEREHIQFASRQVTVRVEGGPPGTDVSPALGAFAPVIEPQNEPQKA